MTYYNSRGFAMPESAAEQARVAGTSAGNETINAPAGHSSLSGEGGGDLLIGNNLDNRHWITHPTDRVVEQAGGGIDTMIGWTSIKLAPNVENLIVNGQLNYAVGNDLANLIVVDDNSHFVWGAGGDDVLVGGAIQRTTFMVRAGEGSDVIYNWNGNSQLQLWNYGFESPAEIKAAMTQVDDDVVLKLSATETLTFRDETISGFQDRQFLLPLDTSKLGDLTFHDEFDSLQVYDYSTQTGQWRSDFGGNLRDEWAYTLTSNGERQVYTTHAFYGQGERQFDNYDALSVDDGLLTIKAERLLDSDREAAWGREYSSGMLNTYGIFEQQYGYFEMRAELPSALGAWPAFWMIPFPYAAQVEADIMEGLAATPNVDYRRAWGGSENLYDNGYKVDPTGMHTYGMLWTPSQVTFYFDGVAVMQTTTPANWDQPMAMIVNLAVGGWGGEPNSLQFPAEMKIDYVRAYELADGSTITETGTPEAPAATMRTDGGLTTGAVNTPVAFDGSGQAVTSAKIAVYDAEPTTLPPGQTFVIWEDSGAVFGAVSNGSTLGEATALMAGDSRVFTGSGTWLTDGKVALAYMAPDGGEPTAWVMIFDPAKGTFTKHELGVSRGDIDIVALKNGGFAASWETPDGDTMGRAFDAFAYDGKGWYGPAREVAGDFTGVTAGGEVIATTAGGQQQLYDVINPPRGVNAVVSIGPMAGVTHDEGDAGATLYTFTVIRDWDQSEKVTVGWQLRGQGANPANGEDFEDGVLPSGTVTFEINQTTAYVQVWVQGDAVAEADEQFLITLVNPVGAKLGQATATGFITDDDTGGGGDPPPAAPTLSFAQSTVTQAEGNTGTTAFTFTVTRTGASTGVSSVNWSVAGSGANPASAADFTGAALPTGTLTFAAGETSKTITVNVAGDTAVETNEGFTLTLSGASGATVNGATATGTITNDDSSTPPPSGSGQVYNSPGPGSTVTAGAGDDTLNASQGNDTLTGGAGADTFAFKALPWSAGKITDFVVGTDRLDLSAVFQSSGYAGSDPIADGRMKLEADGGGTRITFDRDGPGGDWPFTVTTLQGVSPTGLTWAQLSGGGTTTPPPPPGSSQFTFATATLEKAEGTTSNTTFSYVVTRAGDTSGAATVGWSVAGSGTYAADATDFVGGALPSGTLSFAAGETSKTIEILARGDSSFEDDNGFKITLANPTGATLGSASTATGVILDDDIRQSVTMLNSVEKQEGQSGVTTYTFQVRLEGQGPGYATVNWGVTGAATPASTAFADAQDFVGGVLPTGTLRLEGFGIHNITVQVVGDTTAEPDEGFKVTLSDPSRGTNINGGSNNGLILNDDGAAPPPSSSGQVYTSPGPGSTVTAGAGNDTINASQGADTLTGGAGADKFAFGGLPWSAGKITDFVVGTDRLDLSAIFQASGYTGSDPIADGRMRLESDGAGGTKVFFDRDAPNTGDWPFQITTLQGVSPTGLTWAQLSGGGGGTTPPPSGPTFSFAASSVSHPEGNGGGETEYLFTVVRNGSTAGAMTIDYATEGVGSNPASADDFWTSGGVLRFSDGQSTATALVRVKADSAAEADETFRVVLRDVTVTGNPAIGTIVNDDAGSPPPSGSGQVFTSQRAGDTLTGTAGADTLNASQGPDRLTGGGGGDQFVFANPVWNAGQITDFTPGTDKIDLRGIFDQAGYTGSDPVRDGWLILQPGNGGTQVIVDMDGPAANGGWPITITTLTGVTPGQLTSGDWIVQ